MVFSGMMGFRHILGWFVSKIFLSLLVEYLVYHEGFRYLLRGNPYAVNHLLFAEPVRIEAIIEVHFESHSFEMFHIGVQVTEDRPYAVLYGEVGYGVPRYDGHSIREVDFRVVGFEVSGYELHDILRSPVFVEVFRLEFQYSFEYCHEPFFLFRGIGHAPGEYLLEGLQYSGFHGLVPEYLVGFVE